METNWLLSKIELKDIIQTGWINPIKNSQIEEIYLIMINN